MKHRHRCSSGDRWPEGTGSVHAHSYADPPSGRFPWWSWRSQIAVLAQKILQQGDFDLFLADHAFEGGDLFLFLLQPACSTDSLRAVVLELLLPVGERHGMHVVRASNLRVGSIGLKRLKDNLAFELGAVRLAHSGLVGFVW